ncbi:cyclic nucleotide-binding domain-containing protein [Streptomyces sp. MS06]|uniref:cyclic nucleotide-binding domain-containing protein n=1 Tax=Streptomyces sp. MS06 TaxID=3385974 RepID=UPI00399FD53B
MTTAFTPRSTRTLPVEYRGRLMGAAREVRCPQNTQLFREGGRADRFWILQAGTVAVDMRVPGRRATVIETVGPGELLGWSWLFLPHVYQFGARTVGPVRAHEFDAAAVRAMCADDPAMGQVIALWVGSALSRRLRAARTRLLDLYAPYGSGARG